MNTLLSSLALPLARRYQYSCAADYTPSSRHGTGDWSHGKKSSSFVPTNNPPTS
jgi:hypothetical protein